MIKKATTKDISTLKALNVEVQDLHHQIFPKKFKPSAQAEAGVLFGDYFEEKDVSVFIAYSDENEPVGYIVFRNKVYEESPVTLAYQSIYIEHVAVKEAFKGKGFGKELIDAAMQEARSLGIDCVELDVWSQNVAAKGFFEKLGFMSFNEKMVVEV